MNTSSLRVFAPCLAFAIASIALAGCCCPGDGGGAPSCTAQVKYKASKGGKTFVGKGSGATQTAAKDNACWDYCFSADPTLEAKFAIWKDGADGKAYARKAKKYKKEVSIRRIIIDDDTSFEAPFHACVSDCVTNATKKAKGLAFAKVTCAP